MQAVPVPGAPSAGTLTVTSGDTRTGAVAFRGIRLSATTAARLTCRVAARSRMMPRDDT